MQSKLEERYENFQTYLEKRGITNDKLSKRSTLYALSLGQCMIK
jgi:hypothetical protein